MHFFSLLVGLQTGWSWLVKGYEREKHETGCGFEQLDCPFPKELLPGCQGSGVHSGSGVPTHGHGHQAAHHVSRTMLVEECMIRLCVQPDQQKPVGMGGRCATTDMHSCEAVHHGGTCWDCNRVPTVFESLVKSIHSCKLLHVWKSLSRSGKSTECFRILKNASFKKKKGGGERHWSCKWVGNHALAKSVWCAKIRLV